MCSFKPEEDYYYDWFEIVEEQSDGHLAWRVMGELEFDLGNLDPKGFLVVDKNQLPDEVKPFIGYDRVTPTKRFRHSHMVLLQNDKLSKYLALAQGFKTYTNRYLQYVEVIFEQTQDDKPELTEKSLDLNNLDGLLGSAPIYSCWELFRTIQDKELVAKLVADIEKKRFRQPEEDAEPSDGSRAITIADIMRLFDSFVEDALLAVIYAWLKKFKEAQTLLSKIGLAPVRHIPMTFVMRFYLELLIVNEQKDILEDFFKERLFRLFYRTHYEIYLQTFVDPDFTGIHLQQARVVRRRIEDFRELYL